MSESVPEPDDTAPVPRLEQVITYRCIALRDEAVALRLHNLSERGMALVIAFSVRTQEAVGVPYVAALNSQSPYVKAMNVIAAEEKSGAIAEGSTHDAVQTAMEGTLEHTSWNEYVERARQYPSAGS